MYENDDFEWDVSDEKEFRKQQERIHNHPLLFKSKKIFDLARHLYHSLDQETDEMMIREQLLADASMLASKFSGAQNAWDYILKMENSVVMKIHARSPLALTSDLRMQAYILKNTCTCCTMN